MSSFLDGVCGPGKAPDKLQSDALIVRGIHCKNTAAKFWASLFHDISCRFPDATTKVEFSTFRESLLSEQQLYPEVELGLSLEKLSGIDVHKLFMQTLAEIEMCGAPPSVHISIWSKEGQVYSGELPSDCIDAEIFPYLLVWMLEWAEIPSFIWNQPEVSGEFIAYGKDSEKKYHIRFTLHNTYISEELYRLIFVLYISRSDENSTCSSSMQESS